MEVRLSEVSWRRDVTNFAEAPMFLLATLAVGSRLGLGNAIAEWANMTRLAPSLNIPIWEQQVLSIAIVICVMVKHPP
jgi:hypothetical protein